MTEEKKKKDINEEVTNEEKAKKEKTADTKKEVEKEKTDKNTVVIKRDILLMYILAMAIGIFAISYIAASYSIDIGIEKKDVIKDVTEDSSEDYHAIVVPEEGIVLPVDLGNLGKQMISSGVIDRAAFEKLYEQRGGLDADMQNLLSGENNDKVVMDRENSNILLNYFWAFGLANKNEILDNGPMVDERYGGDASKFASTGGWTLARGDVMDHYSRYNFVELTAEQQARVESVSKNIYRPCCGNSVYFPDCNHGMAMLGLLEIMASQGADEAEMYETALQVNSYWFADTYMTLAKYFAQRGVEWKNIDAREVLGSAYSGSVGFRKILEEVEPVRSSGGGSCGV